MATFKVGDVVKLKSGGPAMTVTMTEHGDEALVCEWIDERGKHDRRSFPSGALEPAGPPGPKKASFEAF